MSRQGRPNLYESALKHIFVEISKSTNKKKEVKVEKPKTDKKQQRCKVVHDSFFGAGERIIVPTEPKVDNGPYLPNTHIIGEVIGKSGCGKTYYLTSFIPQIKVSQIGIFSSLDIPIYNEIRHYCEDRRIDFYKGTTIEDTEQILEQMEMSKPEKTYGLIVWDDFNVDMTTSRNNKYQRIMNKVNGIYRNKHYHQITLTQSSSMVSTLSRNNCNLRVIFKMDDAYAKNIFIKDWVNITNRSEEDFHALYDAYIAKIPHSFLQIVNEKVFIYIPEQMSEMQEVNFGKSKNDLKDDVELNKLAAEYVKPLNKEFDAYNKQKMKQKLSAYIQYTVENNNVSKDEIMKYLHDKYKI